MNKGIAYFGTGIPKDVFDVMDSNGQYFQFTNDYKGFKSFKELLNKKSHCAMEATGYYHYRSAYYLIENNIKVSVENPLSVKRFIQMRLSKTRTDRSDAKMICLYAQSVDLKLWEGQSKSRKECLQTTRLPGLYFKQTTALKNKIHGGDVLGNPSLLVVRSLKRSLKYKQKEIRSLEEKPTETVKQDHQELLAGLESIPGLGRKTSIMLIVLTDGFERFASASELCPYPGLTPIIGQSGTSVKGRPRISKMGNKKLRDLLFMCSLTACKNNKACKALYDRIVAKGKSKKPALIAVCNKLLKQAFAIARSGLIYDETYRSTLVEN